MTETLPRDFVVEARAWLRRHVSNNDEEASDLVFKLASAFSDVSNRARRMGQEKTQEQRAAEIMVPIATYNGLQRALEEANEMVCRFHMPHGWIEFQTRWGLRSAAEVLAMPKGAQAEPRTEQPSPKDSPEQREPATPEKCGTGRAPDQRPGADDEGETTGPSPDREAGVDQPSSPTSRYLPLADREPRSLPPSGSRTSDACIVCGGCGEPDEPCPGCGKEKIEAEPFIAPAASKGSQHTTKAKVAFTQDDLRHMRESLHCLATNAGNLVRRLRFEKREFDRAFEGLVLHQAESAIALWRETYEREVEQMAEVSPNTNQRMFTLLEYTEAAKKVRRETLEEAASLVEKLASGYASDSVRCRHVARELRALAAEGKR